MTINQYSLEIQFHVFDGPSPSCQYTNHQEDLLAMYFLRSMHSELQDKWRREIAPPLVYVKTRTVSSCSTIPLRCEARCILKSHLHSLQVLMEGNNTSTPDGLVDVLIGRYNHTRGKNFDRAIRTARTVLGRQWNAQR